MISGHIQGFQFKIVIFDFIGQKTLFFLHEKCIFILKDQYTGCQNILEKIAYFLVIDLVLVFFILRILWLDPERRSKLKLTLLTQQCLTFYEKKNCKFNLIFKEGQVYPQPLRYDKNCHIFKHHLA